MRSCQLALGAVDLVDLGLDVARFAIANRTRLRVIRAQVVLELDVAGLPDARPRPASSPSSAAQRQHAERRAKSAGSRAAAVASTAIVGQLDVLEAGRGGARCARQSAGRTDAGVDQCLEGSARRSLGAGRLLDWARGHQPGVEQGARRCRRTSGTAWSSSGIAASAAVGFGAVAQDQLGGRLVDPLVQRAAGSRSAAASASAQPG